MIVLTVPGSVQLPVIGIFGHYLGCIREQTRGWPLFLVEDIFRSGKRELATERLPAASAITSLQR